MPSVRATTWAHAAPSIPSAGNPNHPKIRIGPMSTCTTHADHPHTHGPDCGHVAVAHGDHIDYIHDGHAHRQHDGHWDECELNHVVAEDHGDHVHGPGCGHETVAHGDHVDYLHDGHRHAAHDGHYDEH